LPISIQKDGKKGWSAISVEDFNDSTILKETVE
jgi:hypothetical protein